MPMAVYAGVLSQQHWERRRTVAPTSTLGLSALAGHREELGRRLIKGKSVKVRVLED